MLFPGGTPQALRNYFSNTNTKEYNIIHVCSTYTAAERLSTVTADHY